MLFRSRVPLAATTFLAIVVPLAGAYGQTTDAREILDQALATLGGDAYRDVTDVRATGRYYQFQRGEMVGSDVFRDYILFPDKERTEFGQNADRVRINNGDRGWNIVDGAVEPQIPEQVALFHEEFKVSLDHLLRAVLPESRGTLQFVGRDMMDFRRVDILEVRDEDRTRVRLFVDRSDRTILKKSVRRLDSPAVHEEVYSNYHEFQGVLTPLLVTRYTDGAKTMEIRFEEVKYNSGLSEDLFLAEED
jgi:hypothetical protein